MRKLLVVVLGSLLSVLAAEDPKQKGDEVPDRTQRKRDIYQNRTYRDRTAKDSNVYRDRTSKDPYPNRTYSKELDGTQNLPPGLAKRNGDLPPGLRKRVRRKGQLPPGVDKQKQEDHR